MTFSNISYSSLTRFIKITGHDHFKKFSNIPLKFYLVITILASILINIYVCFEYSIQLKNKSMYHIPSEVPFDYFKMNLSHNEEILLNLFQFIKIIFSDLLFFVLNIICDVTLVVFLHKKANRSAIIKKISKKYTKMSSKRRLKIMIILNSINFIVLRVPFAITDFYGLFVSISFLDKQSMFHYEPNLISFYVCRLFRLCDGLQKFSYSLYLLSFFVQFLIFLKFDSNFSKSVQKLKIYRIFFH